jgi:hypothetical protein
MRWIVRLKGNVNTQILRRKSKNYIHEKMVIDYNFLF